MKHNSSCDNNEKKKMMPAKKADNEKKTICALVVYLESHDDRLMVSDN